jgi:glycosyltransferase involved in cell wall biosynthesis
VEESLNEGGELGKWPEGEVYGGVAVHFKNLVKDLGKLGNVEMHVLSFGKKSHRLQTDDVSIVILKVRPIYYVLPFLAVLRLAMEVRRVRPDIVHIQGSNISPYLLYARLCCKTRSDTLPI